MEVILKTDIKGLGYKNDLVPVKPGYGRNYLIPQGYAVLATKSNRRILEENIKPIEASGKLEFVKIGRRSREENVYVRNVFPDMDVFLVNGHTEAMMIPHIRYKERTVIFMADLIPSVNHIPVPWVMAYDTRPLLTLAEKKDLLEVAADKGHVLFFEHDPEVECATVERTEKGIRLKETFRLSEL